MISRWHAGVSRHPCPGLVVSACATAVGHRLPPYATYAAARLPLDASFESYTMDFEPEVSDDQTGFSVQLQALGDAGESRLCFDDFLITTDAEACAAD